MTRQRIYRVPLLVFVIILAAFVPSVAQQQEPIILQNADLFTGKRLPNGEDVREVTGNVRFRQGNVRVWCDKAVQFLNRNEVELMGSVKVVRDTVTLTAKRGRYFGNARRADCEGNVRLRTPNVTLTADVGTYYLDERKAFFQRNVKVVDSTSTIDSDQLTYFENERKSIALLHVRIVNARDNITMFGDYLEHYDSTRYSKMAEHPRLLQIDTAANGEIDTLAVRSEVMESFDDSTRRMVATDSVLIARGGLAARSGLVRYHLSQGSIELYRSPVVWYEENQVTGDTIELRMKDNALVSAAMFGHAFVLSQSDSTLPDRYDQLTGRTITMRFRNKKLQETDVSRNAVSLYYLYEDSAPNGVNRTSGDNIRMEFNDGRPATIHVTRGIEGSYYPEKLIAGDPGRYNLDGFRIVTGRPTFATVFPARTPERQTP